MFMKNYLHDFHVMISVTISTQDQGLMSRPAGRNETVLY